MRTFNCLIVDDEPIARDIVQTYCAHLPYLRVAGACGNALEAKIFLQQENIDIIFLDINMPVMDGMSFLSTLRHPPQVILTTAYQEYAVKAFDLAVCDYLLKPFSLDRFMVAVDKAAEKLQSVPAAPIDNSTVPKDDVVFIRADGKIYKIACSDLLYAEASGNYTKLVLEKNTLLPQMSFSTVEDLLPKKIFLRVHRSFIINKTRINHVEGNRVYIGSKEIPIGSNYKEAFLKELGFSS